MGTSYKPPLSGGGDRESEGSPLKIYLASAALRSECFDLTRTVEVALGNGFFGVQLYLTEGFLNESYIEATAAYAEENDMDVIVHLVDRFPRESGAKDRYVRAVQRLLAGVRQKRALIHYSEGMEVPTIPGVVVGLENAISGYDKGYYSRLSDAVREHRTFFVFDIPRLFGAVPRSLSEIDDFIRKTMSLMEPSKDVLHLIDVPVPGAQREEWCILGSGLLAGYMDEIVRFKGPIVLEFEDIDMALASKRILESRWASLNRGGSDV
jgi:hypothetical protein